MTIWPSDHLTICHVAQGERTMAAAGTHAFVILKNIQIMAGNAP